MSAPYCARPVTLSVGEHVRLPRVYRGRDVLWWMDTAGVWDQRYDEVEDLTRARRLPSPQLVGTPERTTLDLNALTSIGVDPGTLTIADASGVSQYDRVTPSALVTLLRSEYAGRDRDAVLAALPVAGRTGTLQGLFAKTPLEGAVFAKTGTMQHTRNLAGFVMGQNGRMLVFALLINDWIDSSPKADAAVHAVQEKFLAAARVRNPQAAPERSSDV